MARPYRIVAFLVGTFAFSWAIWLGELVAVHYGVVSRESLGSLYAFGGLGPSLAALLLTWRTEGGPAALGLLKRPLQWRVHLKWYAFALGIPVLLRLAALALFAAAGGTLLPFSANPISVIVQFAVGFLVVGTMEEYGWRGYLQPALSRSRPAGVTGVLVGLAWAVWHFPLFAFPGTGYFKWAEASGLPLALLGLTASVVSVALLYSFQFYRTGGNLFLAFLLHAAVNTSSDVFFAPYAAAGVAGPVWWFLAVLSVAGLIVAWFLRHTGPTTNPESRAEL